MKLIKPSFEIIEQSSGLEGIYKQIERAGRTCYKSEDKITKDSASKFVERMVKSGHGAMLEHGTVYLKVTYKDTDCVTLSMFYGHNKYSKVTHSEDNKVYYITTNYRVLVENNHLGDFKYLCEPTEYHEKRVTVRFTTDRGVSHEFVRHRVFSFAQESTRYCNYSKDKFGNELTFIIPSWMDLKEGCYNSYEVEGMKGVVLSFMTSLGWASEEYMQLLNLHKLTPQQARQVLPNALKTELVMTGFISDWQHFFDLRARGTTGAPHPDAKALAEPLMQEFIKRNLITQ